MAAAKNPLAFKVRSTLSVAARVFVNTMTRPLLNLRNRPASKGSFSLFIDYLAGYFRAKKNEIEFLVSEEEGQYIRNLRWKGIFRKFQY